MEWVAARVATGKEYYVRHKIKQLLPDVEILIPRRYFKDIVNGIVKTKSERLLPGYLLLGSITRIDPFLMKGFMKIIGRVTEVEIAVLRAQEGQKDGIIGTGNKVLVIDGPFSGCNGVIDEVTEEGLAKCRLTFQGMEIKAEMKPELLSTFK